MYFKFNSLGLGEFGIYTIVCFCHNLILINHSIVVNKIIYYVIVKPLLIVSLNSLIDFLSIALI